ncbi:MAG: hypothetical protein AAGA77_19625 [Bacteroidota bacterium]
MNHSDLYCSTVDVLAELTYPGRKARTTQSSSLVRELLYLVELLISKLFYSFNILVTLS